MKRGKWGEYNIWQESRELDQQHPENGEKLEDWDDKKEVPFRQVIKRQRPDGHIGKS